jgi:hypothetical protein
MLVNANPAEMSPRLIPYVAATLLADFTAGNGQAPTELAYTQEIEVLCRQYAASVSDMPADAMFKLCMSEHHCQPASSPTWYWCEIPQPKAQHGGGY